MQKFNQLIALSAASALVVSCNQPPETASPEAVSKVETDPSPLSSTEITESDMRRHISILSSDEYEGRAPGTTGGEKTRKYLTDEFARMGLEPIGDSYDQRVPLVTSTLDPSTSSFNLTMAGETRTLDYRKDVVYWTKRITEKVTVEESDLVFVGYGVVAPEYDWNDYEGLDVTDKIVVMLVNDPGYATQNPDLFNGNAMTYYGRWVYKFEEAARQGAAGAIVIHETAPAAYGWNVVEGSWSGGQIDLERSDKGASRVGVEAWISYELATALFESAGLDLKEQSAAALSPDFKAVPLGGASANATLMNKLENSEDANVIGIVRGKTTPDEYILYTAHWDHLGSKPGDNVEDHIYNGAVDNATGTAAIMEVGEFFAKEENQPDRSIIIAAVTAEESGLLGSAYFAENPLVPLKQIVAGINIDGMLPTPPVKDMIVVGYGASELEDILQIAAAPYQRRLTPDPEAEKGYFYRSDHISFAKKGVPMLYADGGLTLVDGGAEAGEELGAEYRSLHYHQPSDEYNEDWPMDAMVDTTKILRDTGSMIANSTAWPNWYEGNEFRALRDAQRAE